MLLLKHRIKGDYGCEIGLSYFGLENTSKDKPNSKSM